MKYLYLHGLGQNADSWNKVTRSTDVLENSVCPDLAKMIKGKAKMEFGTGDIRMTGALSSDIGALSSRVRNRNIKY